MPKTLALCPIISGEMRSFLFFVFIYVLWFGFVSHAFAQTSNFTSSLTVAPGYRGIDYRASGRDDLTSATVDLDLDARYSIDFETLSLELGYSYNWRPFIVDLLDWEVLINPTIDDATGAPIELRGGSHVLKGESDKLSHQSHTFTALLSLGRAPLQVDVSGGSLLDFTLLNYLGTLRHVQAFFQPSFSLSFAGDIIGTFRHRLLGNWSYLDIDYDYLMGDIELGLISGGPDPYIDARANYRIVDYFKRTDNEGETKILAQIGGRTGLLGSIASTFFYYPQVGLLWEVDDNRSRPSVVDLLLLARIDLRQELADWVDLEASYGLELDVSGLRETSLIDQEVKAGLKLYFPPQGGRGSPSRDGVRNPFKDMDRTITERDKKVRKGP
jgi:hypothetical protein